jgi:hypothetical protein
MLFKFLQLPDRMRIYQLRTAKEFCNSIKENFTTEEMDTKKYEGMGIFQEAKQRKLDGMGYRARRFKILWQSKTCSWQHLMIEWGIRWSDQWQLFPIRNVSDNCHRAIMFGFWKLHLTVSYARAGSFNQDRKLFLRQKLWKFYQLVS